MSTETQVATEVKTAAVGEIAKVGAAIKTEEVKIEGEIKADAKKTITVSYLHAAIWLLGAIAFGCLIHLV